MSEGSWLLRLCTDHFLPTASSPVPLQLLQFERMVLPKSQRLAEHGAKTTSAPRLRHSGQTAFPDRLEGRLQRGMLLDVLNADNDSFAVRKVRDEEHQ